MITADVAVLPLGVAYVFRNAHSSAGALGGLASEVHIHDASVNERSVAFETDCRFIIDVSGVGTVNAAQNVRFHSADISDVLRTLAGLRDRD